MVTTIPAASSDESGRSTALGANQEQGVYTLAVRGAAAGESSDLGRYSIEGKFRSDLEGRANNMAAKPISEVTPKFVP